MNSEKVELVKSKLEALNIKPNPLGFCDRDALKVVELLGGEAVSIEGPLLYRQSQGMMWGQRHIIAQLPNEVVVALSDPLQTVFESIQEYISMCIVFTQD